MSNPRQEAIDTLYECLRTNNMPGFYPKKSDLTEIVDNVIEAAAQKVEKRLKQQFANSLHGEELIGDIHPRLDTGA